MTFLKITVAAIVRIEGNTEKMLGSNISNLRPDIREKIKDTAFVVIK